MRRRKRISDLTIYLSGLVIAFGTAVAIGEDPERILHTAIALYFGYLMGKHLHDN